MNNLIECWPGSLSNPDTDKGKRGVVRYRNLTGFESIGPMCSYLDLSNPETDQAALFLLGMKHSATAS